MKATDLMVGDYICLDGDVNYDNPIRIQQIGYQGESDIIADSDVFGVEDIIPIPLTEYILVKNGFKHSMPHNDWTNADCNFYLYEGGNGYRIQNTDIKLDYVHQLQHLLRLCGIEKEITI